VTFEGPADWSRSPGACVRPLRVLTFLHSFEPGGVERVALRLHGAWLASGVDARLVMGRDQGVMRREWPLLHFLTFDSHGVPTAAWETLWMIIRLPGAIRQIQPDVLFCAGNSYTVVSVAMKLLLGRKCPPIIAKMSNDLYRRDLPEPIRAIYHAWLRIQGRLLDRLVGMAPPMHDEIAKLMRVPATRIAIVDDPSLDEADIERLAAIAQQSVPGTGRRFLAIGRLAAQKNFGLMIDAFARMARPDDTLTILGEGGERARLEDKVRKYGLSGRIKLPGHVNPLDTALAGADALVMSSDYEGVPAVVAEALAAALPIVATNCSTSMDDLLDHERFGLLVETGDVAALADAMDKIEAHPFDVAAARRQAQRFTVQKAATRYLQQMEAMASA
jgi:glycosyltransferase involved in cell wall biosynthesis